jgi:hypothetical protein
MEDDLFLKQVILSTFPEEKNNRPPKLFPILFFFELKPHATFQNPKINPSGRKVIQGEEREEEKTH